MEHHERICEAGHTRVSKFTIPDTKCMICLILNILHKVNKSIICISNTYTEGDKKIMFSCEHGHMFLASTHNCYRGCRSCYLLSSIQTKASCAILLDNKRINMHEDSYLRFTCKQQRHNPLCNNAQCVLFHKRGASSTRDYSSNCINFIACNRTFYATPKQIKYVTSTLICETKHVPASGNGVVAALRIFELLFGERFDDHVADIQIEFTGYNAAIGLAFIHMSCADDKYIDFVADWCVKNHVILVAIPKKYTGATKMSGYIVTELSKHGLLSAPETIGATLRDNLANMNANHMLFID